MELDANWGWRTLDTTPSFSPMQITDWIQFAAVLVAVAASIVALIVATCDRRTQIKIAAAARAHDRLRLELEYAVMLGANRNKGGSTDPAESARLGAEALAYATVVGQRWVPRQWIRATDGKSPEEMRALLETSETETPEWVKDKIETGLAITAMLDELYREE